MRHLGHFDCGVYAEVVADGAVNEGEALTPARRRRKRCRSPDRRSAAAQTLITKH
jgi:MOSC domain-containing protein YiiM